MNYRLGFDFDYAQVSQPISELTADCAGRDDRLHYCRADQGPEDKREDPLVTAAIPTSYTPQHDIYSDEVDARLLT